MRKNVLLAAVLLTGVVLLPLVAGAASFRGGERSVVNIEETVADDLYIGGGTVRVNGAVEGDAYVGGGNVRVTSAIGEDLVMAGGNVSFSGTVGDDLRVAGGSLEIQGAVADDLIAGGGEVFISGEGIGGDLWAGGGSVEVEAPVAGNARLGGGSVYLNSQVTGDVIVNTDKLTLGPRAMIIGNLTYTSPEAATITEGAQILGAVAYTEREAGMPKKEDIEQAGAAFLTGAKIVWFLMLLVGALIVGFGLRRYSTEISEQAHTHPLFDILIGIITLIVLPIFSILLMVTVIGIPFGVLGLLAFFALLIWSWFLAPVIIGALVHGMIWKSEGTVINWKSILLGVLIYALIALIPFIGPFVQFALMLLSIGAIAHLKWKMLKDWR